MNKYLIAAFAISLLNACGKNSSEENDSKKSYTSEYAAVECDKIGPDLDIDNNIECGWLTVPESRYDVDNNNEISLAVLILKSESETPEPDPIIYLHGGPGSLAIRIVDILAPIFEDARKSRDIIFVDQRGSGYSIPFLGCPETLEQKLNRLEILAEDTNIEVPEDTSLIACQQRLMESGIDLASYTTVENTNDIEDLRKALNIDQWNLYGVSYGTRVSQTMMQLYPNGIRSVILDSAVPQNASLLDVSDTVSKYNLLIAIFEKCAVDSICNTKYPDLANRFWDRISLLENRPSYFLIDKPEHNFSLRFQITETSLVEFANNLIDRNKIEELPNKINLFLEYEYSEIAEELEEVLLGDLEETLISYGTFFSTMCADEYKNPYDESIIDDQDIPDVYKQYWRDSYAGVGIGCEEWPFSKTLGLERTAVISDIPTLILAGKYDVRTTTDAAQIIEETLTNVTYAEFPKDGHGVLLNACSHNLRDSFYETPLLDPDVTCLAAIDDSTTFTKPNAKTNQLRLFEFPNPYNIFKPK